jgi:geranylgeranyl diphosphate synthase type II
MESQSSSVYLKKYNEYSELIESKLREYLSDFFIEESIISKAMKYSLLAGGKRLRPVLTLAIAEMLNVDKEDVLPFACALEMIHTYSLIHDDLPAMDNDDLRRGKPTNHKVFGEAMAILAGDGLLNLAFETMTKAVSSAGDEEGLRQRVKAMQYIANASGAHGMVLGQAIDLNSENSATDEETIKYMHDNKTGALIKAAILISAIIGGAGERKLALLEDYASALGLAFQIRDDILDVEGNTGELGKSVGKDAASGKNTFVAIFGLEHSRRLLKEETEKAAHAAAELGENSGFLIWLAMYLASRSK